MTGMHGKRENSYTFHRFAGMAQLVAHPTCNRKVRGSSPLAGSVSVFDKMQPSDVDDDELIL